jgi:putative transposase
MRYEFMRCNAMEFSIGRMSKVLNVSRSGYYNFLRSGSSDREKANAALLVKIKKIHKESRQTYGSPRIHAALAIEGESCSRKKISYLMKKAGIAAKMKKRFKVTTKVDAKAKTAPNLLSQDFTAQAPNQRWVADITYRHHITKRH